jgi:hypothetical protein
MNAISVSNSPFSSFCFDFTIPLPHNDPLKMMAGIESWFRIAFKYPKQKKTQQNKNSAVQDYRLPHCSSYDY